MLEVAVGIFVLTYVLISLERVRGFVVSRPLAALLGAGLMVLLGVLSWQGALAAIQARLDIFALLVGMLVVVAALDVAGLFDYLAKQMERRATTARRFFIEVCVASAVLSALFLNDAVVLLFTPAVIRVARSMGVDPLPFLIGEAICANIGSTATIVGNPQNAYIGLVSGIPFARFSAVMVPITAVCLAVGVWAMLWIFRRELEAAAVAPAREAGATATAPNPRAVKLAGVGLAAMVTGFTLSSFIGVSIAVVALGGGGAFLVATTLRKPKDAVRVVSKVDWGILAMFAGLFIVLDGLQSTGALAPLVDSIASLGGGNDLSTLLGVAGISAAGSNAISNVPAVLLLSPALEVLASERLWLTLAASSTMAGNATLIGAAANLIVAERAKEDGVEFPWKRFLAVGFPVSALTVSLSTVLVWLAPL